MCISSWVKSGSKLLDISLLATPERICQYLEHAETWYDAVKAVPGEAQRPQPMSPRKFKTLLDTKTFTNKSDKDGVFQLYKEVRASFYRPWTPALRRTHAEQEHAGSTRWRCTHTTCSLHCAR